MSQPHSSKTSTRPWRRWRPLYYPPDPGQESGSIGGNINTNAGGMRALKYGTTRDYVQALEVVLPSGEIINVGGKVVKDTTGYSLLDLLMAPRVPSES